MLSVCFRGGILVTVQGDNMDVVLNSRMVVTVIIRKLDATGRNYADEDVKNYPAVVCHSCSNFCSVFVQCEISRLYTAHPQTRSRRRVDIENFRIQNPVYIFKIFQSHFRENLSVRNFVTVRTPLMETYDKQLL